MNHTSIKLIENKYFDPTTASTRYQHTSLDCAHFQSDLGVLESLPEVLYFISVESSIVRDKV